MIATAPLPSPPASVGDTTVAALLAQARQIAADAAAGAAAIDREDAFPVREFAALGASGLLGAPLSRLLGGLGLGTARGGMEALLHILTTLGWGNLSLARLYEGHVNALGLIQTFGTPDQARRLARDAVGQHIFAVWNTEGADGIRLIPIGGDRYRLEGAKTFASGAGHVTRPLLTGALPDGGWQMVVPAMEHAGGAIDTASWRPLGMRASASYTIDLSGFEIGPDALIGAPGDYYRQPWFSGGAIRFAAAQLGGAIALLDATRAELHALGRAADPFQRSRVGEAAIATQSGMQWLRAAASMAERSPLGGAYVATVPDDEMVAFANMTRTAIERICLDVLEIAERAIGARALLQPHPIERIGRDLTLYLRQPAPDATLLNVGEHVLRSSRSTLDAWSPDGVADGAADA